MTKLSINSPVPIVYHEDYNIRFFGLENFLHYFDSKKYGRVFANLGTLFGLKMENSHRPAEEVSTKDLELVHTKQYLDSLNNSSTIASIVEIPPLSMLPVSLLQSHLLRPMKLATAGTILASQLALQHGWSINLSGGYHHAKGNNGEGFCVFADIPLAIRNLLTHHENSPSIKKALIIDLDAHQGNGYETLFVHYAPDPNHPNELIKTITHDDRIEIFDIYNGDIYPRDSYAKQFITYDFPIPSRTSDVEYLDLLQSHLDPILDTSKPSIVFYNAGTDIFNKDPLGALSITRQGIIARDELVFRACRDRRIPIVMVLSGGYTRQSARIITESIANLVEKGIISWEKKD